MVEGYNFSIDPDTGQELGIVKVKVPFNPFDAAIITVEGGGSLPELYKEIKIEWDSRDELFSGDLRLHFRALVFVHRGNLKGQWIKRKFGVDYVLNPTMLAETVFSPEKILEMIWDQSQNALINKFKQRKLMKRPCDWEGSKKLFMGQVRHYIKERSKS